MMEHIRKLLPLMVFLLSLTLTSYSQTISGDQGSSSSRKEESNTDQGSLNNQYLIGSGDVLDIRVFNRPNLSRENVRVDGDGMIRMPLIKKRINAACRTETALAEAISKQYEEYLRFPHVEVFIKEFQSKPVVVFGAIREPGRFQMRRKIRLLELLSIAGGPTEVAGGRIQIRHDLSVRSCNPGNTREPDPQPVEWVELKELLASNRSDDASNPVIRPGDIINLTEADKIYVTGNVFRPTVIALKERVTLTQALAIAGGVMRDTDLDRIRISRRSSSGDSRIELIADLKAIRKKQAKDIVLEPNDIIEVRTSRAKRFVRGLVESVAPGISRLPVRVIR